MGQADSLLYTALFVVLLALAPASHAEEKESAVNLDVKDQDVRLIFKSMKEQCGIRNLLIDKDVNGNGTFILHDVPCSRAFDIVARTMGLTYDIEPNSVVNVQVRR